MKSIPIQRPYLGEEELAAVRDVFSSRWLGMGPVTRAFEESLKEFLGVKHVIAVNTGTSALHIALDALGLAPGDEVLLPSLTFIASAQAIVATAARPVFCEVYPETLTLDVADAAQRITPRTRAIMPVHYAGLAYAMDEVLSLARQRGLRVVEDAAHAFGSRYKGRMIGALGDVTCFSFDPIKNITCGEGGAVATGDDELAARILPRRVLGMERDTWSRHSGQRGPARVVVPGFRYHLSDINAAIGLRQLARREEFQVRKQEIVRRYDAAFADLGGVQPLKHTEETFPFMYVVRVQDGRRDELMSYLKDRNIDSGIHYVPNHLQPLFQDQRPSLPVTEQLFQQILTLPLYWEMTDEDIDTVIAAVRAFSAAKGQRRSQVTHPAGS
jgi:perosamine synthetase